MTSRIFLLLLLVSGPSGWTVNAETFLRDVEVLTRQPHRLAGTAEGQAAAEYVRRRLDDIGIEQIITQDMACWQTRVLRCELSVAGRTVPMLPLRPNLVVNPVTGPRAVSGRLMYAGDGETSAYGNRSPDGAIVLLDYESDDHWQRAFAMGAKAVIFIGGPGDTAVQPKHIGIPANLLRFHVSAQVADAADLRRDREHASVISHVQWELGNSTNVFAYLTGTDPVFDSDDARRELLVLSAHLDTFGQVPQLSPGARNAANVAALLEAADYFKRHRPRRNLLLAFLNNRARHFQGAREFYSAIDMATDLDQALRNEHGDESDHVSKLIEHIGAEATTDVAPITPRGILKAYRREAAFRRDDINQQLVALRTQARPDDQAITKRLVNLEDALARCDETRRALSKDDLRAVDAGTLASIQESLRHRLRRRHDELARLMHDDHQRRQLRMLLTGQWIALHVVYSFSDGGPNWGVVVGDSTQQLPFSRSMNSDRIGRYTKVLRACRQAAQRVPDLANLNDNSLSAPFEGLWSTPGRFVSDGVIAGIHGIYNISLMTHHDARPRDGHPADTLDRLRWWTLRDHAREGTRLVEAIADEPTLSLKRAFRDVARSRFPRWHIAKQQSTGDFVGVQVTGSLREDRPAMNSLVAVWPPVFGWARGRTRSDQPFKIFDQADQILDFDLLSLATTNTDGRFRTLAARSDAFALRCVLGTRFDPYGRLTALTAEEDLVQSVGVFRVDILPVRGGVVGTPLTASTHRLSPVSVLNAGGDSGFRATESLAGELGRFAFFYVSNLLPTPGIKLFQREGAVMLGVLEEHPVGAGFGFDRFIDPLAIDQITAHDLWKLNETRLRTMRERRMPQTNLEQIHGRAGHALQQAGKVTNIAEQMALLGHSAGRSRRIYQPVKTATNDLVHAIVLLLLLAIPFALAMERLLVGSTNIYRRLAGFVVIFAVTFALLYAMHPGFAVATTPMIVLLAVAIVLLSLLVIYIVLRKFNTELRELQGQASRFHKVAVSRIGTLLAAVDMGMSTMRRRPLRTALTATTVVILTLAVLCFASAGSRHGVRHVHEGPAPEEVAADLMIRRLDHHVMSADVLDLLKSQVGSDGLLAGQWWLAKEGKNPPPFLVTKTDHSASAQVAACIGVDPREVRRWPALAAVLQGEEPTDVLKALRDGGVFLPRIVQNQFGLDPGDPVLFNGRPTFFAGAFDARAFQRLRHLDGQPVLPVDFTDPAWLSEETAAAAIEQTDVAQREFRRLPADQICVASAAFVRQQGGRLHLVNVYRSVGDDTGIPAEHVAEVLPLTVWARGAEGVERLVFTQLLDVSGGTTLIVPVVLGGLIIFSTLLGSITDREHEIETFSALGLAPIHVGFLFFAEAAVYAVIGGMGGQLLALAVSIAVGQMSEAGWIPLTSINFSSTHALFAMGIVMATVLVSALYPAVQASRSANPGLQRTWHMPSPDGDELRMIFPFTVSAYDMTGIISFLAEYFREHGDAGLGVLASRHVRIEKQTDSDNLYLSAEMAVAPFDLGVTQAFGLESIPSPIPGVHEVMIMTQRMSGSDGDWRRLNRVFIRDLRKQFLLWRTLSQEVMDAYRMKTMEEIGREAQIARNE